MAQQQTKRTQDALRRHWTRGNSEELDLGHSAIDCPLDPNLRAGALLRKTAVEADITRIELLDLETTTINRIYNERRTILVGRG